MNPKKYRAPEKQDKIQAFNPEQLRRSQQPNIQSSRRFLEEGE